jgi:hypothetical protein
VARVAVDLHRAGGIRMFTESAFFSAGRRNPGPFGKNKNISPNGRVPSRQGPGLRRAPAQQDRPVNANHPTV